jgi:hypothetical protein
MFDELESLRDTPELQRLLGHYAEAGAADPEAWQDRLAHLEGIEPQELVRLHGLLIAFGWLAQNTGNTPAGKPGVLAACYRVTADGVRALRRAAGARVEGGEADAPMGGDLRSVPSGGESDSLLPRRRPRRSAISA